jgi:HSP20 family protein
MVVFAEVPGLHREDIDIEIGGGRLIIKGERKSETERTEEGWLIRERSYGSFERSVALPEGVDPNEITADYKDGVLEVHVPKGAKALEPETHHVAIGSGGDT